MIDAIRSEWIKLTTITSTWVLLIVAVAFPVVITVLTASFSEDMNTGQDLADVISGTSIISSMLIGVVAAVGITGEFGHNTIRPTFAAMPDRMRPLVAKPIVNVAVALVLMAAIVVASWVLGAAILEGDQSLSEGTAGPALIGVVLLAIGLTLLGYGLGLLVRNAALALCILLLWPLVVEGLIAGLMSAAGAEGLQKWLPYFAGFQMASVEPDENLLGRVPGGIYFFAWVAVILAFGLLVTRKRDA